MKEFRFLSGDNGKTFRKKLGDEHWVNENTTIESRDDEHQTNARSVFFLPYGNVYRAYQLALRRQHQHSYACCMNVRRGKNAITHLVGGDNDGLNISQTVYTGYEHR